MLEDTVAILVARKILQKVVSFIFIHKCRLVGSFWLCALLPHTLLADTRQWRSSAGTTIEAKLIENSFGQVILETANGRRIKLMCYHLSLEDQAYLSDLKNVAVDEAVPLEKSNDIAEAANVDEAIIDRSSLESFKPVDDAGHKIHVYKPLKYAAEPAKRDLSPILFLFQPNGNSMSLLKRMKPIAEELGWLIVGVDAYRNTNSLQDQYRNRMNGTKAAYEWAMDNLVFDPRKIVFGGFSGGGWWAYQCTAEIDKRAAAVISLGGWMGNMHDKSYAKKMAVAQVNGSDDSSALAYENKDSRFMTEQRRADVKAFRFNGGHVVAPEAVLLKAARWIHSEKKF